MTQTDKNDDKQDKSEPRLQRAKTWGLESWMGLLILSAVIVLGLTAYPLRNFWVHDATRNVAFVIGGLIAIYGVVIAARRQATNQGQFELALKSDFSETFAKGVSALASDSVTIKTSGIRVFENLAKSIEADSDNYDMFVKTIHDFIRESAAPPVDEDTNKTPSIEEPNVWPDPKPREQRQHIEVAIEVLVELAARPMTRKHEINFDNLDLRGLDMRNANLRGAFLIQTQLDRAHLEKANLSDANLYKANLVGARLLKANLSGANLNEADLRGARLFKANMRDTNLTEANLTGANLNGVDMQGATLDQTNLTRTQFIRADMSDVSMRQANLTKAKCFRADMRGADLALANLALASLQRADFSGASLMYANLSDASIISANEAQEISREKPEGYEKEQVTRMLNSSNFTDADLTGADFTNVKAINLIFSDEQHESMKAQPTVKTIAEWIIFFENEHQDD